jgi:hypothetical protein
MKLVFVALQNQLLTRHTGVGERPTTQVMAGRSISRVAAAAPAASFKSLSSEESPGRGLIATTALLWADGVELPRRWRFHLAPNSVPTRFPR